MTKLLGCLLGWLGNGLMSLLCAALFVVSLIVSVYLIVHLAKDVWNWIF